MKTTKMLCGSGCLLEHEISLECKTSWQCLECRKVHTFTPIALLSKRGRKKCQKEAIRLKDERLEVEKFNNKVGCLS